MRCRLSWRQASQNEKNGVSKEIRRWRKRAGEVCGLVAAALGRGPSLQDSGQTIGTESGPHPALVDATATDKGGEGIQ